MGKVLAGEVINSPCMDCKNRHINCHSDCKNYNEYRNKCEEFRIKMCREQAYQRVVWDNLVSRSRGNSKFKVYERGQ